MKESSTYQYILKEGKALGKAEGKVEGKAEGKVEEARHMVLLMGGKRFGEPDKKTQSFLNSITEPEAMEQLALRLFEVESWQELLK